MNWYIAQPRFLWRNKGYYMLARYFNNKTNEGVSIEEIKQWTPVRLKRNSFDDLRVVWAKFGQASFAGESFFSREIKKYEENHRLGLGEGYLETGIDALLRLVDVRESLPLKGLVFHTSHSGSTLVSNMLGAIEKNLAISEPVILKDWTRLYGLDCRVQSIKNDHLLKSILSAYGEVRTGVEANYVVKLSS